MKPEGLRFAIVVSRWNDFLTTRLMDGAVEALEGLGVAEDAIEIFMVPGSFELPGAAAKIAHTGSFDAIIALGVVIRGETAHFDHVAGEAARGIAQVGIETGLPVLFGVITANTLEQAVARCGAKLDNKGYEAALAAVEMADLYRSITSAGTGPRGKEKAVPYVV